MASLNHSRRRRSSAESSSSWSNIKNDIHNQEHWNNGSNNSSNLDSNSITLDAFLRNQENTRLNGGTAGAVKSISESEATPARKTVDDVWREIVEGKAEQQQQKVCKEEAMDEMMTLEDFLVKAGVVEEKAVAVATPPPRHGEVKVEVGPGAEAGIFAFESSYIAATPQQSVELKRKATLETLDKATIQRQRRMIKNRESAARSRERKQAYQVELESIAVRLEEENEQLLKEKMKMVRAAYQKGTLEANGRTF